MNLFVYGTLRSEFSNEYSRLLRAGSAPLGRARAAGRLYLINSYPGMRPALHPDEWVEGEVYRLHNPDTLLPELDAYEGSEYTRIHIEAELSDGGALGAWVYLYREKVTEDRRILTGNFLDVVTGAAVLSLP